MPDTSTRRVLVRGQEKTVKLKRRDLDEPRRLKRAAREAARAKARADLGQRTTPPTNQVDKDTKASK